MIGGFMSKLNPGDPKHKCKECGKVVGPGDPIIVWVVDEKTNNFHFKCAYCRGFMSVVKEKKHAKAKK